jgi:hypothetical protein
MIIITITIIISSSSIIDDRKQLRKFVNSMEHYTQPGPNSRCSKQRLDSICEEYCRVDIF